MENEEIKIVTKTTMIDEDWNVEYELKHIQYANHKEIEVYNKDVSMGFSLSYTDKEDLEELAIQIALENAKLKELIDGAVEILTDW